MKNQIICGLITVLLAATSARAGLYPETFSSGGAIPDGNPVGATFSGTVSDAAGITVSGLTVGLNISGGYNGNLYAYLVAPNGTLVMLMNQPGVSPGNPFGASGSGMNITLQDGLSDHGSIQSETSSPALSGSYNAEGSLAGYSGSAANGTWELFFADDVNGGGTSTLTSWSLGITAVPEPVNAALGIFGAMVGAIGLGMKFRRRFPTDKLSSIHKSYKH